METQEKINTGDTEQSENKSQNGCGKSLHVSNLPNCQWTELTSQKAQSNQLDGLKTRPTTCCPKAAHLSPKDEHGLKVMGWKMILRANNVQKAMDIAVLLSDKTGFKTKKSNKRQLGTFYNDKGDNSSKNVTFVNIYAPNLGASNHVKPL